MGVERKHILHATVITTAIIGSFLMADRSSNNESLAVVSGTSETAGKDISQKAITDTMLSDEVIFQDIKQKLSSTLDMMGAYQNPDIIDAVQKLSFLNSRFIDIVSDDFTIVESGSAAEKYARVVIFATPEGTEVRIALSKDIFTSDRFTEKDAAIALFEALYIYQHAKQDPSRFRQDESYRQLLESEAKRLSQKAFKNQIPSQTPPAV